MGLSQEETVEQLIAQSNEFYELALRRSRILLAASLAAVALAVTALVLAILS